MPACSGEPSDNGNHSAENRKCWYLTQPIMQIIIHKWNFDQETERLRHDIEQLEKRNQLLESSVELLNTARTFLVLAVTRW